MRRSLNDLLKQWASDTQADPPRIESLRGRVTQRLRAEKAPAPPPAEPGRRVPFAVKAAYAAAGAAAALLLVIAASGRRGGPDLERNGAAALAAIPRAQLRADAVLFRETDRLFAPDLEWIARRNGQVRLGLPNESCAPGRQGEPIAVRITVVCRQREEQDWRTVWQTDLLTRTDQLVQAKVDAETGGSVHLWAYPVDQGRLAVDSRVTINAPVRFSASASRLVELGKPVQILSIKMEDVEYRVLQTVEQLPSQEASHAGRGAAI